MTFGRQGPLRIRPALPVAFFILLLTGLRASEAQQQSATGLISLLAHQTDSQGKLDLATFDCGQSIKLAQEDRGTAVALAALGSSAASDIEGVLDSMVSVQQHSLAASTGWLLYAYAKVMGPAAYPRLRSMASNSNFSAFQYTLDNSIALSLGLTSYVSPFRVPTRTFRCRAQEPRDALDQLIVAWERNDRPWLSASLGPAAKAALKRLLKRKSWGAMRAELWHGKSGNGDAIGYRFETSGPWSEPEETLDEALARERISVDLSRVPADPKLDTAFKSKPGRDCEEHRIDFLTTRDPIGRAMYLVNNSDLGDLLGLIASCSAETK